MTDTLNRDTSGRGALRAFASGALARSDALDALEKVEWTTNTSPEDVLPPDNSWHLVDVILAGTPGAAEFRAELAARVRARRQSSS